MRNNIIGLQLLRFFAAMLVVFMHTTEAVSLRINNVTGNQFLGFGSVGVDIFFVISGFVMAISTPASTGKTGIDFRLARIFMTKRLIRVAPLYWFYTIAKIIFVTLLPALALRTKIDFEHILWSFLFIPSASPWGLMQPILPVGWTLNYEMLFYIIFAISMALNFSRLFFPLLVFSSLFIISFFSEQSAILNFYSSSIVYEFTLGIVVYYLYKNFRTIPAYFIIPIFFVGFCMTFIISWNNGVDRIFSYGLGSSFIVFSVVAAERYLKNIFNYKVSILGDISYSIYLSHSFTVPGAVFILGFIGLKSHYMIFLAVSIIVISGGFLSYFFIETPLTKQCKRYFLKPYAKQM